jgi:hypothetical protein
MAFIGDKISQITLHIHSSKAYHCDLGSSSCQPVFHDFLELLNINLFRTLRFAPLISADCNMDLLGLHFKGASSNIVQLHLHPPDWLRPFKFALPLIENPGLD